MMRRRSPVTVVRPESTDNIPVSSWIIGNQKDCNFPPTFLLAGYPVGPEIEIICNG
jgi:hypothetical protein